MGCDGPRKFPIFIQVHEVTVSDIVEKIRWAIEQDVFLDRFRAADVRHACPSWDYRTCNNFLPTYRLGNPSGHAIYFKRNADGSPNLLASL